MDSDTVRKIVAKQSGSVVISGSRSLQPLMVPIIMKEISYTHTPFQVYPVIIVGDARGVDTRTVLACQQLSLDFIVCGCEAVGKIRLSIRNLDECPSVLVPGGNKQKTCYAIRDKWMIDTALLAKAAVFLGVWDGQSKGTILTADYAKSKGMPGKLVDMHGRLIEKW